ncbi:MAG: hypothetical protein GXP30_12125, partial [Verrucomicrobia bacterium]|nr:hypothetical protein [Verrucomicrobiota bacterium]
DPDDFTLVRGFFAACHKARDYQPALKMINRFLNREIIRSKGMTNLYLVQKHAYFLGLARDLKTLRAYGNKLPVTFLQNSLNPSESDDTDLANEYYRVLIDLYREKNQPDEELDILFRLKARKVLTRQEQLEGGRILLAQENTKTALEWLEAIELNHSQPKVEIDTLYLLADIYAGTPAIENEKFAELTRHALKYDDNALILHLADQLQKSGLGAMAESALLLRIRSSSAGSDKPALLFSLINSRLIRGEEPVQLRPEIQTLLSVINPSSDLASKWLELVRSEIKSNARGFRLAFPRVQSVHAASGSPVLLQLTDNLIAAALAKTNVSLLNGLNPGAMTEAELLCVLEQLLLSKNNNQAPRLLSEYAAANEQALGYEHPARMIQALAKLGDSTRVAELHARLMMEPVSETFRRRLRLKLIPGFIKRQHLPRVFAEAGYPNLAGSLYRVYLEAIQKNGRVPGEFLSTYADFLIDRGDYPAAENLLVRSFRRSSSNDDETILKGATALANLYEKWESAGKIQNRMERYHLSSGLQIRVEEILEARLNDKSTRN